MAAGPEGHDGEDVLRLIMNLIPSNALQYPVRGDTDQMPYPIQWQNIFLREEEVWLITGDDRKCFFYIRRVPSPWHKLTAFRGLIPGHLVGRPDCEWVHPCSAVVGMGWTGACGVVGHLHRNMVRHAWELT